MHILVKFTLLSKFLLVLAGVCKGMLEIYSIVKMIPYKVYVLLPRGTIRLALENKKEE